MLHDNCCPQLGKSKQNDLVIILEATQSTVPRNFILLPKCKKEF